MTSLSPRRRSLQRHRTSRMMEQLESRVLLSANFAAHVTNGLLYVQGDNGNDNVVIDQASLSLGQFRVASGNGVTTINGQSAAVVYSGVTGIVITTGAGNDTVTLQNAAVTGNAQISGSGNEAVTLNNFAIGGNFTNTGDGGQNSTLVENSSVQGSISVNVGAGYNSQCGNCWCCQSFASANEIFTLNTSNVGSNVAITNASGETTTTITGSTIGGSVTVNNGSNSYGSCNFNFGCGNCGSGYSTAGDLFVMTGATVTGNVSVSNASDGNNTDIEGGTIGGNLSVNNNVVSNGGCGFNVCGGGNYATASDAFTLNGATVFGNVTLANVSDGATATITDASMNNLTINNGVGTYGQGCCICAGSTTSNGADALCVSGSSSINGNVCVTNGSTYNATIFDGSFIAGSISVADGLNLCTPTGGCNIRCCCGGKDYSGVYTTDLFTLTDGAFVAGSVAVTNASGYTSTTIESSFVNLNVTITDSSGTNYFTMDSSTIGGNLVFVAGTGTTDVLVTQSIIGLDATITVQRGATVSIAADEVTGTLVIN